jgi:hypothetical protein
MGKTDAIDSFNRFREVSLKNAGDLLRGAKALLDAGVEHASFHLSLLALEEIGKQRVLERAEESVYKSRNLAQTICFGWGPEPITSTPKSVYLLSL